jgi:hypothetical protein
MQILKVQHALILLTGVFLSACVSSSIQKNEEHCLNVRWHFEGQRQSMESSERASNLFLSCQKNMSAQDIELYLDGYYRGLERACTFDFGYYAGVKSLLIKPKCSSDGLKHFERGLELGLRLREKETLIDNRLVEAIKYELDALKL